MLIHKTRAAVRAALFVLAALAVAWLIHFVFYTRHGLHFAYTNVYQVSHFLKSFGRMSYVLGASAALLQTIFPFLPFVIVAGANVLTFGMFEGFVINYTMACLGATISFLFARYMGHEWVERKLAKYPLTVEFNKRMESNGFLYVLIGRFIPIIPSTAINMGAGVTRVKFKQFILATIIGKLPMVFLDSLFGHDLMHIKKYRSRLLLLIFIFIALIGISSWVKKKWLPAKNDD